MAAQWTPVWRNPSISIRYPISLPSQPSNSIRSCLEQWGKWKIPTASTVWPPPSAVKEYYYMRQVQLRNDVHLLWEQLSYSWVTFHYVVIRLWYLTDYGPNCQVTKVCNKLGSGPILTPRCIHMITYPTSVCSVGWSHPQKWMLHVHKMQYAHQWQCSSVWECDRVKGR